MGKLEDRTKILYPREPQQDVQPSSSGESSPSSDPLTERLKRRNPAPTPSDEDITSQGYAPWNLPPNVSQGDYWGAEGRKIGGELRHAAANVGTIFADDMGFGLPGFVPGVGPDYRARVDAARSDTPWAARTGVDAMAFLANKPFQAARFGLRGGQMAARAVEKLAPQASKDAVKAIARRVGNFVEGGAYTGAQSAGHGDDATTVGANTVLGGGLGLVGDEAFSAAKDAGAWLRSKWGGFQGKPFTPGTPEGTPTEIAAGPPPGSPARTPEQAMDANQMNLWRSQSKLTNPPNQENVASYARKVYGEDPAQWPEALRDIHSKAGQEGGTSTTARILGNAATQAGVATANYLGLGLSPEIATALHVAGAPLATEAILPRLPFTGASSPTPGAITNAFPALTGWRPNLETPDWRICQ